MRSSVSSTCGFSAASIAASDRLPWSSSSSSSGSGAGAAASSSSSSRAASASSSSSSSSSEAAARAAGRGPGGAARAARRRGAARRGGGGRRRAAGAAFRPESTLSTSSASIWPEKVVSRSITSRSMIASSSSSSRQMVMAWKVSGLSQRPGDHGVAPGLDALGDGDLALAGEELHRAHLAQVHAHRVVGAVERLAADARSWRARASRSSSATGGASSRRRPRPRPRRCR